MPSPADPGRGPAGTARLGRRGGSRPAWPVALVLGTACFVALLALVETGSPLLAIDRRLADRLNGVVADRPVLVTVLERVTAVGGSPASWVILTALALALLVRRQWWLAGYVAVTGLGAVVLSPTVKELVGRLRPTVEISVASAPGPSFPSGHATGSVVTYGVLLLVLMPVLAPRFRWLVIVAAAVLVVAIGFTRLALGVHFLTDVIGGWLLGLGWLTLTTVAFRARRRGIGLPTGPATRGLAPEAAPDLAPAPGRAGPVVPHPWRRAAELSVGWVLLLGILLAAGRLVTDVFADTATARIDTSVVRWLAEHRTPAWTGAARLVGQLGSTPVVLALAFVAGVLALAVTRRWRPVLFLSVVLVGELALFLVTGSVVDRPRPPVVHLGPVLPTTSFPSGHVSAATSLYVGVAVMVITRIRSRWRWAFLVVAVLIAASVALSRLYYGVHYPTDVLGSLLLAVPWLIATWYVLRPGATGPRW